VENVTKAEPDAGLGVEHGEHGRKESVIYVLGSIAGIVAVTFAAAWLVTSRWPHRTRGWQVTWSALSVPLLSVILFLVTVLATLADAQDVPERGTVGMVIFSMVFFLFYAVAAGLAIGVPTAMVAVRVLRRW
jgi:small-conductance mechanosensitive channel